MCPFTLPGGQLILRKTTSRDEMHSAVEEPLALALALALGGSLSDGAWHLSKPEDRFMALAF
jgi:hypothetical protein